MSATPAKKFAVYISADATTQPVDANVTTDMIPIRVSWSANSVAALSCTLQKNLAATGRLSSTSLEASSNKQVEIWEVNASGDKVAPVFWGAFARSRTSIGGDESQVVECEAHYKWHYGQVIYGQRQWSVEQDDFFDTHHDLEFNPEIDGIVRNNMLTNIDGTALDYPIWADAEAAATVEAVEHTAGTGQTATAWTLRKIVEALCAIANANETYIKNPTTTNLDAMFDGDYTPPDVKNVIVKRGAYLPQYLTQILVPHGYGWYIKLESEDIDSTKKLTPRIAIYKRGGGTEKTLLLQNGGILDESQSQLLACDIEVDLTTVMNKTVVHGALIEREVTIPLYRAWADDAPSASHSDASVIRGRVFVANEAGDYNGLNGAMQVPVIDAANFQPHRRVAEDLIEYIDKDETDSKTQSRVPVLVEYSSGGAWTEVEPGTWDLLPNQLGIYVTATAEEGEAIPEEFLDENNTFRMTCTVKADKRIEAETDKTAESPVSQDAVLFIDASDRFFDRARMSTGTHASVRSGTGDTKDDATVIQDYADAVAEIERSAGVSATASLFQVRLSGYAIGDVITKIQGREISLNANTSGDPKYPQLVGLEFQLAPSQITKLRMERANA